MEVVALTRIIASPVDLLLKTVFGQWDVHRACQSLSHDHWNFEMGNNGIFLILVVPLLTSCSLWLISVVHAPQKVCDSAAAVLGSVFLRAGCCGYVRQSALEGCFYEHWPIYQTKESKQGNGREGECNLWGALWNSSGLPSVLQRGLLFSHALQLGFWSVIIKEIK